MSNSLEPIGVRLDADRKDLLDLTLRNPLLNYRPRARGLELVGESPAEVFRLLVGEGKAMSFLHNPAADGEAASADAVPRPGPSPPAGSLTDLKLQTTLSLENMESRLLAIYYAARTSIEEQGVNTLYLALGMLTWYEADAAQKRLRAPLILVPVELERSSARERFRLRHDGEDLGLNLSLAEKLKAEFRVVLPEMPDADDLDVASYFDAVTQSIQGRPRWEVERESVALGFFSFGKFLMYLDLDQESWPAEARPQAHPILQALLGDGFHEAPAAVGDDEPIDPHLDPRESRQVVDADSSQILALIDANRGRNLVIQGPPGTGKSQTITNLIAESVGRGKKVLFVAEKMAALEVVKRRLDNVGLGDACLELHSHKTNKKGVVAELRRTLDASRPRLGAIDDDLRLLTEVRDRLNAYCEAVNTPVSPSAVTPHQAFGELLRLRDEFADTVAPRPEVPAMPGWKDFDYQRRLALVEQMQARLSGVGVPREHPFWGSRRTVVLPSEVEPLRRRIDEAQRATDALRESSRRLAELLRLEAPADRASCEALVRGARRAVEWPRWQAADLRNGEWLTREMERRELLAAGARLAELHRQHDPTVIAEAWDQDLLETRQDLNTYGRSWFPMFRGAYRRARRRVTLLCRGVPPQGLDEQLALIDAIMEARRHRETVRHLDALAGRLFGAAWQGEHSSWTTLTEMAAWVVELHCEVRDRKVPAEIIDLLASRPTLEGLDSRTSAVEKALETAHSALAQLLAFLEFDESLRFGERAGSRLPFSESLELLNLWAARPDTLAGLAALNVVAKVCREEDLGGIVAVAETWPEASRHLARVFRRSWFEGLLERAYRQRPSLAGFDGRDQDQTVARFRDLDTRALRHAQARLAHEHWQGLPRHDGGGQLAVLRREFEKKARHLPVRQLMARAGNAVQAIKPVFMMSPLSVASYLPPGSIEFDLVVFDEASQVRPVDALGALLRGRQAIVVGDSRQLPPTSFFDRLTGGDDLADDVEASRDVESILGLFASQGAPQRMLRWHYRSRHESLIAVSNHEFYDDRLVVFPSPDAARHESGLVLRHLPQTAYDRGKTRTNPGEAEAVALAVMAFAHDQVSQPAHQRLTLGVAAFSMAQMQAIVDQLERLRREDATVEEFFAVGTVEPFFVKNLENVQGDERDVIFISVGYGRTAEGELAMSFGPLNNDGGERRLNVLITRARRRCEVFTNLRASDIDLTRTSARGVGALKTFLDFAQTGKLEDVAAAGRPASSPFEEAVRTAISVSGPQVQAQVGSAGFRIDLAVVDPAEPGRYLLGIELDGESYQSARSARDRDRLRRQVLEGLGWRIHRIWSTAWFRDPQAALTQTLAALHAADQTVVPILPPSPREPVIAEEPGGASEARSDERAEGVAAYQLASLSIDTRGRDLHEIPARRLAAWVDEVVRIEGPIHKSEAARRIVESAGGKRIGNRIQAAFDLAVELAIRKGSLRREGEFLWPTELTRPVVRDRSELPQAARKLDLVAPEEVAAAIERVVLDAFGMEPIAIPPAACRLLGFNRVSDEMRRRVESIVDDLVLQKRLVPRGEHLVIPDLKLAS